MLVAAGGFGNDVTVNVIASIIASAIFLALGFLWGKSKERQRFGKKLEDYDFYLYAINRDNFPEFSPKDFRLGMHYFLRNFDPMAARQLIFIGEQNNVRGQLEPSEQKVYARLFARYDGKKIENDTREYLENFSRIVHLIGKSFPNLGIEILLHDLSNPSRSLVTIENNVTGRHLHQHRCQLSDRGSAQFIGKGDQLFPGLLSHRHADRGKHPQSRRVREGAKGQTPLQRRPLRVARRSSMPSADRRSGLPARIKINDPACS